MSPARRILATSVLILSLAQPSAARQAPVAADLPEAARSGPIAAALRQQAWADAERLLVDAIEREPQSRELLAVLGHVFLAQRKPLNAAIAFKKADAIAPLEARDRFALVLAYVALQRGDWARPELERLLAAEPANALYEYWLGRLDYDAGQYASAVRRFEQVIARDPAFVRAHDNLGLCFEALNEPERALPHYRTAVDLNRKAAKPSGWPPLNLAVLLRHRGELDEAERLLREAVAVDDQLAQAHYQLGVLLEELKRPEEAVAALTRAAERDAAYAQPHYALSRLYRRLGRPADSRQALATFEKLHAASRRRASP